MLSHFVPLLYIPRINNVDMYLSVSQDIRLCGL